MERIKEALSKAKAEAQGRHHEGQSTSPARERKPPEQKLQNVSYSETRVMPVNQAHLEKMRIVAQNKSDPSSIYFDILRTQVLQKMEENGWKTLAITSPVPGCGKTVVAINLAISIAQHSVKTAMLVDFDLRRPAVAKYLGIQPNESLNNVLEAEMDIPTALVNPGINKLVVLPTAKPFSNPAEMLSSPKAEALIEDLKSRYHERIVIFDLPPTLSADDVMTVLPHIDCVLVVVGNGMVSKGEMEDSLRHLGGANLLGVVLNKAEQSSTNQYYY